jgi:heptosyltransferase-2
MDQLRFRLSLWLISKLEVKALSLDIQEVRPASNILICNLDNLGDAIRITPAIRAIKHNWPHAHIAVLASEYNEPVFQNNPYITTRYILKRNPGPINTLSLLAYLRKLKFSHSFIFCFGPSVADYCAIVSMLAGIPIRVGLNNVSKTDALTYRQVRTSETNHVEWLINTMRAIGVESRGCRKEVFVTPAEEEAVREMVGQCLKAPPETPIIVVAPGGFGHVGYTVSRVWPVEYFRQLVIKTIESYPKAKIVITGNERDCQTADMICKDLPVANALNWTNKVSVRQLAALLKMAAVVITNDNGTVHLADAVATRRIICITGPTDPLLMLESGNINMQIVRNPLPCGPCITLSDFLECTCPQGQICLTSIAVDDVFSALQKALDD